MLLLWNIAEFSPDDISVIILKETIMILLREFNTMKNIHTCALEIPASECNDLIFSVLDSVQMRPSHDYIKLFLHCDFLSVMPP